MIYMALDSNDTSYVEQVLSVEWPSIHYVR